MNVENYLSMISRPISFKNLQNVSIILRKDKKMYILKLVTGNKLSDCLFGAE